MKSAPVAALLCLALLETACASRMARPEQITNPVRLEPSPASEGMLRVGVEGWISPGGPGSWVQKAEWEEYFVRLGNAGREPIIVESIVLESALTTPLAHTLSLAELQRSSQENARILAAAAAGASVGLLGAGTAAAAAMSVAAAAAVVPVAIAGGAAVAAAQAYREDSDRRLIEQQFSSRGHRLPRELAPGQSVLASAFFRLTSNPARIVVHYRTQQRLQSLEVDVAGLGSMVASVLQSCRPPLDLVNPLPPPAAPPLFIGDDGIISVKLERLIVPNGPGSRVGDAFWDEYYLAVRARKAIRIDAILLHDAGGRHVPPQVPHCSAMQVPQHGRYLRQLLDELKTRQTLLPLAVPTETDRSIALFYPVLAQATFIEVRYHDGEGDRRFQIEAAQVLSRAHAGHPPFLVSRPLPERIERDDPGFVRATLTVDPMGAVRWIQVVESVPPGRHDNAARRAFSRWRYLPGEGERVVEARIDFGERVP
jgi:TonB family protein